MALQLVRDAHGAAVLPQAQLDPSSTFPAGAQQQQQDALGQSLHWPAASSQWLQISAVVLGEAGRMRCLGPSVHVLEVRQQQQQAADAAVAAAQLAAAAQRKVEQLALEEEAGEVEDAEAAAQLRASAAELAAEEAAAPPPSSEAVAAAAAEPQPELVGGFDLTPPPPSLVSEEAVNSARVRLEMVADRLGLSGAAEVSAYMHCETGELAVSDVNTLPDLGPGALIFRQVRLVGGGLGEGGERFRLRSLLA